MSKKTLFSLLATILGVSGVAQSATSKIEFVGRGFNVAPKEVDSSPTDKSWKSGGMLALVWFPEGASAKGKFYSYYTLNKIESDRDTNVFEMPEDCAVDSIVAVGASLTERAIVASSFTGTPLSSANVPPNSGSAPPLKKRKKANLLKKTSASKSANSKSKLAVRKGAKKHLHSTPSVV